MASTAIVYVQYFLMVTSALLNSFGVYCLRRRKRRRGNINQVLLQQNLAIVEIIKMIVDLVPLTLYYFFYDIYEKSSIYFAIGETYLMTVLYCAFFLVTFERLLCVLLESKYCTRVKYNFIVRVLILVWVGSVVLASVLYGATESLSESKLLFYIICDAVVLGIICFTYPVVVSYLRKGKKHRTKKRKTLILATLLTVSFVCFNLIPDILIIGQRNAVSIYISSLLWSLGYVADPLVYVFAVKNIRKHAHHAFKVIYRLIVKWIDG